MNDTQIAFHFDDTKRKYLLKFSCDDFFNQYLTKIIPVSVHPPSKTKGETTDEKSMRLEIGYLQNEVIVQCGYIHNLTSESNSDTDISPSISLSIDRDTHNGIS